MNLFNTAILVTAAAAVVLLVKLAFGNRITPRGHMLMWILVAASVLAVPLAEILPESDFSAKTYLPQSHNTTETVWVEPYENLDARGFEIEEQGNYYTVQKDHVSMQVPFTGKTVGSDFTATVSRAKIENYVWIAGAAAVLLLMLTGTRKQKRRLKALPCMDDANAHAELDELKKLVGIRDNAKIQIRSGADSTFLTFMGGQYLIALEDGYTQEERRRVLAHELTHLAHGDLIYNLISAFFLAAFWWNPVIWLAFRRFRRDMEVYCDYDAARKTGDKKGYAETLVRAAAGTERFILGTTSFIGGEKEVSARVKALAAFKKPKTWIAVLAVIVLAGACVCIAVNPKSKDPCTRYFRDMQAENFASVSIGKKVDRFHFDEIQIDDTKQREELAKLFRSVSEENFADGEPMEGSEAKYRLYVNMETPEEKAANYLELIKDEALGEDMYCISKTDGEGTEDEEISGRRFHSPELTALLKEYEETNLHMGFTAEAQSVENVRLVFRNTEYDNPDAQLQYDGSYRLERYQGDSEDNTYLADKWEALTEIAQQTDTEPQSVVVNGNEPYGLTLNVSEKYGKLEEGTYRITAAVTQKLQSGQIVTKEISVVFGWVENRLRLADWDFLRTQPDGELSEETITKLNSMFEPWKSYTGGNDSFINMNTMPCFFTSEYSSPDKMNFNKFLRYYPDFDSSQKWTPELKEKFENSAFWSEYKKRGFTVDDFITPIHLYRPDVLNESLAYYADISLDDLRANSTKKEWDRNYVPEIDRYVTFTSDAGGGQFLVEKAEKSGDTVTLTGQTSIEKGDGDNAHYQSGTSVLTLKEKDGRYLIQSLQAK